MATVFSVATQPLTLLMMFDTSASIAPNLARVREAARTAVSALAKDDRARIGTFGHEIAISPHLTGDKDVLARVIREEIWPGLHTRLWDALSLSMRQLSTDSGRRALVVLSDGRDSSTLNSGQMNASRSATRTLATRDDWTVYAVNVGTTIDRPLVEIVEDTGGRTVRVGRASELPGAFAGVMDELRHQYLIGIPTDKRDGKLHQLEVRVRRPDVTVRARRTYQAGDAAK
jgi:Ca-activated chloride channel family protein